MNAQIASAGDIFDLRRIVAIDFFRWNLKFGVAISRRANADLAEARRIRQLREAVPAYLHADLGIADCERRMKPENLILMAMLR